MNPCYETSIMVPHAMAVRPHKPNHYQRHYQLSVFEIVLFFKSSALSLIIYSLFALLY